MVLLARVAAVCVFCLAFSYPAKAATVCVLVVESGLPADSARVEASSAWEAGLMDAFFDAGHIVTNGTLYRSDPAAVGSGATFPERGFGIEAAREGGADYLSIVVLAYEERAEVAPATKPSPTRLSPRGAAYRILDIVTGAVIAEGVEARLPTAVSAEDEAREAGKVARIMMTRLKER